MTYKALTMNIEHFTKFLLVFISSIEIDNKDGIEICRLLIYK